VTAFLDMAFARAAAESLMTSTCTITRDGDGERIWNEETGSYTDPPRVTVYSGKCRVRPAATWGRPAEAGELRLMLSAFRVQLPFAVTGVAVDQQVKIDASPDPALAGRTLVVRFIPDMGDNLTARRLTCEAAG
jgi:hypothetical protein